MRQLAEALFALAQRRLGLLARRDVVEKRDLVLRLAGGVALDHHRERHPHDRAVLAQIAFLDAHRIDLARIQPRPLRIDDVEVVGMRDLPPGEAQQLVLRIAEDLAQAPVDPQEATVHADVRDSRARQLEGAPEAPLAFEQARLGLLARRDVDDRAQQPGDLAAAVGESRLVVDRVAQAAVARGDRGLVALAAGLAPQLAVHLEVPLRDRRALRIEVLDQLAEEASARYAEELLPGLVDAEILAVAALEEHRYRQRLDQLQRGIDRSGAAGSGSSDCGFACLGFCHLSRPRHSPPWTRF